MPRNRGDTATMKDLRSLDSEQPTAAAEWTVRWDGHMSDDVGATYGHEPLAFLGATERELIVSGTRGMFRIPKTAIRRLGRGKFYPWFFQAVRIHHSVGSFPKELQFKPLSAKPGEVLERLRALGYPVG